MSRSLLPGTVLGAALAATALVLSACSSAPSTSTPDDDWMNSPLGQIMSQVYGYDADQEAMEARFREQEAKSQELIAECMSEEGFEYVPQDSSSYISYSSGEEYDPESEEWVAQYGYGAVNFPGRDEQPMPEDIPEDPNQDYVMSLSESEQQAYYEALHGAPPDESEIGEDGSYEYRWEDAGCWGWAQHEVQGENPLETDEHKPLSDAINAFYEASQDAPELADLNAKWSSCMADEGYPGFTKQFDAQDSVYQEINEYYESQTEWIEDDPELAEIGEREIELALADLACRKQTDYREQAKQVQWALEEKFVAEHRAEFDALTAALGSDR